MLYYTQGKKDTTVMSFQNKNKKKTKKNKQAYTNTEE